MGEKILLLIHLIVLALISFLYYRHCTSKLKKFFFVGLLLKLLCGLCYGLLYKYYFGYGDTFSYFNEGSKIASVAIGNVHDYLRLFFLDQIPESLDLTYTTLNNPRAYWISKAVSPIILATDFNYWISACYLSLFSFLGTYYLAETLFKIYPENKIAIVISFFLFPSFVFWSSGLTKESLAIGGLFYMIAICILIVHGNKITPLQWILFILFSWIELKIRFFYLAVFLLTFGIYIIYYLLIRRMSSSLRTQLLITGLVFVVLVIFISQLDVALHFSYVIDILYMGYESNYNRNPANGIVYYNYQPTIWSLILNAPIALMSGLFRPSVFDINNLPMLVVAIENLLLFVLFLFRVKSIKNDTLTEKVIWVYILALALFLALSSPNFGTLTRYKVAFLPFFLFLLLKNRRLDKNNFFKSLKTLKKRI